MLTGIPDGSLPDTLASIVKASYLEKLEVHVLLLYAIKLYITLLNYNVVRFVIKKLSFRFTVKFKIMLFL